jgi:alkanesulfonate monooxygenase SsuD/methylene tetrahydromethanopterin reductase-like flavin-dependent oxidoreductase (luciferase family)
MVSPATFRLPGLLANVAATADHVSGGRIELGLGAGWMEREHRAYGFPFPETSERVARFAEQLEIVHRLWTEERVDFHGRYYVLEDAPAQPKPVQQPRPPIVVGGSGKRGTAIPAARFADEYNTPFPTLEQVRERRTRIAEACTRADREPIPFSVMTCVIVGASDDDVRERVRRVAEKIGADGKALFSDPPEPWVLGTVDQVAERFRALGEAGVSRVMCQHLLHEDAGAVALLAEVAARLR